MPAANSNWNVQLYKINLYAVMGNTKKLSLCNHIGHTNILLIFICHCACLTGFEFLMFNATFSSISAISWRPVLVVEEAGVSGENHRPWASNWYYVYQRYCWEVNLSYPTFRRWHSLQLFQPWWITDKNCDCSRFERAGWMVKEMVDDF